MMRVFVYEYLSGGGAAGDASAELLAAGREMRDAVARDLLRIGDCAVTVAAGPQAAEVPGTAPALHPPPGVRADDFVAQQARLHDLAWVVAPETDGVLARLQHVVDPGRWLGCDAAAIALTSSKRATLARAAAQGVTTPLAFAASPATRRWVVKPDDGAGAEHTRLHNTYAAACDDVAARRQRGEEAVLEAWVAGEPLSLSLLCRADRVELLSVNRQQIAIDANGVVSFSGVQIDARPHDDARTVILRDWAQALARAVPGLRGYVGIDLVWHPQRGPVLIEINPRVTMAYVGLSAALQRNVAAAVLAAHHHGKAHGYA
ncbi:MAG TPA: ATP-grasp domain-containing protein [Burkholderiaceae bacterium]